MGKHKVDSDLHHIKLETGTVYQTKKGVSDIRSRARAD